MGLADDKKFEEAEKSAQYATVRIWWFLDGAKVAQKVGLGHASLQLPAWREGTAQYITWGPGGKGAVYSFDNDKDLYGQAFEPFDIPILKKLTPCGLKQQPIEEWWFGLSNERSYLLLSPENNCDGTVVLALKKGGAEAYVPCPMAVIRGAATLKRWVEDLVKTMDTMLESFKRAKDLLNMALHDVWDDEDAVWSLDDWKKNSAVAVGRRGGQVAEIDRLLPKYHESRDSFTRLVTLNFILVQVVDHLETKPRSDRRKAVATLGAQVYNRIDRAVYQINL